MTMCMKLNQHKNSHHETVVTCENKSLSKASGITTIFHCDKQLDSNNQHSEMLQIFKISDLKHCL